MTCEEPHTYGPLICNYFDSIQPSCQISKAQTYFGAFASFLSSIVNFNVYKLQSGVWRISNFNFHVKLSLSIPFVGRGLKISYSLVLQHEQIDI